MLAGAEDAANRVVAGGVTTQTVGKWRLRFVRRRLDGLADEPRPGAPRKVTDDLAALVAAKTLQEKPANGTRMVHAVDGASDRTVALHCREDLAGLRPSAASRQEPQPLHR